jgi:hypothetical protein
LAGSALVLALAVRRCRKEPLDSEDAACMTAGVFSIVIGFASLAWNPNVGIWANSAGVLFGARSAMRAAYKNPHNEPWYVWLLWFVGSGVELCLEWEGTLSERITSFALASEEAMVLGAIIFGFLLARRQRLVVA